MADFDPKSVRLGKRAPKLDPRTLRLARYLTPALAEPPASVDWTAGKTDDWGMYLNNEIGDCTIAAVAHAIEVWSANVVGFPIQSLKEETVLATYEAVSGYNPSLPDTDLGAVEIDVLNYWRKHPQETHRLLAYCDPDPGNREHIKTSVALFGGVYIGLNLPITAQNEVGSMWTVCGDPEKNFVSMPGSWGGHAVYVCAYTPDYLTCITWGKLQKMTWGFWEQYCDEAHTLLGGWWITHKYTPSGFTHQELKQDLEKVTDGRVERE